MKRYEILAPAGKLEAIKPLCEAGADAIYVGLYGYSSRPSSADLTLSQINEAAEICHTYNVRLHVAVNSCVGNNEFPELIEQLYKIENGGTDAVIIADWGILAQASKIMARTQIHASTLLGVYNAETVRYLQKMGCTRVVFSSNLYLDEMLSIINAVPDMEYELIAGGGICLNDNRLCGLPHIVCEGEFRVFCREQYVLLHKDIQKTGPRLHASAVDIASVITMMLEAGIYSFKIEGRTNDYHHVCKVVNFLADSARQAADRYESQNGKADLSTIHYIRRFVRRPE